MSTTAAELKIQLHEKSTDSFNTSLLNIWTCFIYIDVSEEEIKNSTVLIW
jgi:hypothetical protein